MNCITYSMHTEGNRGEPCSAGARIVLIALPTASRQITHFVHIWEPLYHLRLAVMT